MEIGIEIKELTYNGEEVMFDNFPLSFSSMREHFNQTSPLQKPQHAGLQEKC